MPPRRVIVTADDFGLSPEVNEAVERAHREGVLTAASLMVGERAAPDAVAVARRNPGLAVGLHLTLTDGAPVLRSRRKRKNSTPSRSRRTSIWRSRTISPQIEAILGARK